MPWDTLDQSTEIVAIHAALLPTTPRGTVLMFGDWGDEAGPDPTQLNVTLTRLYQMDPEAVLTVSNQPTTNAFCGAQSFLADGRLLVAGGTETWGGTMIRSTLPAIMVDSEPAMSFCPEPTPGALLPR